MTYFFKKAQLKFHQYGVVIYENESELYKNLSQVFSSFTFGSRVNRGGFEKEAKSNYLIFTYSFDDLEQKYVKVTFYPCDNLDDKMNGFQIASNVVFLKYKSSNHSTENYKIFFSLVETQGDNQIIIKEKDLSNNISVSMALKEVLTLVK